MARLVRLSLRRGDAAAFPCPREGPRPAIATDGQVYTGSHGNTAD